ncbi:hypothetical protein ACFL5N_02715, partial [bacterium]
MYNFDENFFYKNKRYKDILDSFMSNFSAIEKILDLKFLPMMQKITPFIRDPFIHIGNNTILIPHPAFERISFNDLPNYIDKNLEYKQTIVSEYQYSSKFLNNFILSLYDKKIKLSYTYFEGGNIFITYNKNGEKKVLSGNSNLDYTLFGLEMFNYFKSKYNELLKIENNLPHEQKYSNTEIAKIILIKKLFAEDFGVDPKDIIFINQVEYHLDLFLFPDSKENIFLVDYKMSLELINYLINHISHFELTETDLKYLKKCKANIIEKLASPKYSQLENIKKELEKNGFTVINIPGNFPGILVDNLDINFMNGLCIDKDGKSYFVIGGADGRIGNILMKTISFILAPYFEKVYFVGRKPNET